MVLRALLLLCLLSLTFQIQNIDCDVQGCISCSSPNVCKVCDENLKLSSIEASPFPVCLANSNSGKDILVQAAESRRMLQSTTCNVASCMTCGATSTVCAQCKIGYYVNSTGGCAFCNSPCQTCTNATFCLACYGGYDLLSGGICQVTCNVTGCISCSQMNYCQNCSFGYTLDPTSGGCNQSSSTTCTLARCTTCATATSCAVCNTGYILDPAGLCIMAPASTCTLPGCLNCTVQPIGNICILCEVGFILDPTATKCTQPPTPPSPTTCPVANCVNCTSTGLCMACVADANLYLPSPTKQACITCNRSLPNMAGCLSCVNTSSCGICETGFQLSYVQNSGICIKCSIPNCLQCVLNGTIPICALCATGYSPVLMGEACSQCSFPCATCNSNPAPNNCQTCTLPFFFAMPSTNGSCIKNYIRGCVRPNLNNITLCAVCATGFTLSLDGLSCNFTCSSNCANCASSTNCTACVEGFYLTKSLSCQKCSIGGCQTCTADGTGCTTCLKGFYLIQSDCAPCPPYCLDCTSNTSCSSLSEQSQVIITVNNQPVLASCDVNCLKCSDTDRGICFVCLEGLFLDQTTGKCIKCSGNCKTCDSTNTSKCLSCYTNNFLSSANLCVACNQNCRTCLNADNPNNCTSCWDGFSLNSSSSCVKGCPKNCFTCTSLTSCTQCLSGYTTFKSNNSILCAPCATSCRTCAEGRPSVCLSCGSGLYLDLNKCKRCSLKCSACTSKGCTTCMNGYYLTANQTCAPRCKFPCSTCSTTNPQSCLSCMAGYTLNGTLCAPVNNCTTCTICPDGFVLKDQKCTACTIDKCQSCSSANLEKCYSCQRGFFLTDKGTCQACPAQCEGCLSANGCLTCSTGYTIKENAVQTAAGFECMKCNSPCATCINNPDYCTTCVTGFTFSGWKCTQNFKFSFNLTLQVTMAVFEEKYMSFILALANATKIIDINGITINSITAGSVNLEASVAPQAPSGTAEAGTQFEGLKTALQGAQIEGMPVGSSSIVVEQGVAGVEDSAAKNMLPIILGICIPIGVLIIVGIVVFFIYGKKTPTNVSRFDTEGDENKGYNFNKTNENMVVQ